MEYIIRVYAELAMSGQNPFTFSMYIRIYQGLARKKNICDELRTISAQLNTQETDILYFLELFVQ